MYSYSSDFKNTPRKKKRKYSVDHYSNSNNHQHQTSKSGSHYHKANSLSINIIDRVLDLSKYNQNTGLYTLSRAWINATTSINSESIPTSHKSSDLINKNYSSSTSLSMNENTSDDSYYVISLPEPDKQLQQDLNQSNDIKKLNENIEVNIRANEKSDMDIIESLNLSSDDCILQTHALLKLHVNRWKLARKEWFNYYKKSNQTYKKSYDILKSIYEDV